MASYEPLVHDVSVSIKHFEDAPLPNDGAVCTVRRQFLEAPHRIPSYVDIRSSHRNGFFIGVSLFALGAYMYLVSLSMCLCLCDTPHPDHRSIPGCDASRSPRNYQATTTMPHFSGVCFRLFTCVCTDACVNIRHQLDPLYRLVAGPPPCVWCTTTFIDTCKPGLFPSPKTPVADSAGSGY